MEQERPRYPFGALWWGAPGVAGLIVGVIVMIAGNSDAGLVAFVIGLSLCWSSVRNYRKHGRL